MPCTFLCGSVSIPNAVIFGSKKCTKRLQGFITFHSIPRQSAWRLPPIRARNEWSEIGSCAARCLSRLPITCGMSLRRAQRLRISRQPGLSVLAELRNRRGFSRWRLSLYPYSFRLPLSPQPSCLARNHSDMLMARGIRRRGWRERHPLGNSRHAPLERCAFWRAGRRAGHHALPSFESLAHTRERRLVYLTARVSLAQNLHRGERGPAHQRIPYRGPVAEQANKRPDRQP